MLTDADLGALPKVELHVHLAGVVASLTERLATPLVERDLVASLETARHQLEHGQRTARRS